MAVDTQNKNSTVGTRFSRTWFMVFAVLTVRVVGKRGKTANNVVNFTNLSLKYRFCYLWIQISQESNSRE
jgi:hypothetical protein